MVAPNRRRMEELASRVAEIVRRELGPDVRVLWFGSWVTGHAVERSDLDIAFDAGRSVEPLAMARLLERVDDLPTLHGIDLVDLRAAGENLRAIVLEEGIAL